MSSFPLRKFSTAGGPNDLLAAQIHNRRANDRAIIENPLDKRLSTDIAAYFTDDELEQDVQNFAELYLPHVEFAKVLRAARVAKDIRLYEEVARSPDPHMGEDLPVILTPQEKRFLKRERDVVFSERGMRKVIITVSLAALLQGFVQSSFNGASFYSEEWGLTEDSTWKLGGTNAAAWFAAALVGCPLSLPINYYYGRRGGLIVASVFLFTSSVAAIFAESWTALLCIRIINGLGMGVKAVSTPILASETAVGFWRGSAILAWQLWVAFGIMLGFAFNLLFTTAATDRITLGLIQGAPLVPALALFFMAVFVCPESPRYHLQKGPNYSPEKAYMILRQLRNTELQALRDMYAVYKSIEQESMGAMTADSRAHLNPGFWWTIRDFLLAFRQLFQQRRLYNALISAATVNVAQQLSGVNVFAFYSTELVRDVGDSSASAAHMDSHIKPMAYSLGFGAINFLFCLPAVRSIDTLGRRRWLLMTLPFMAIFMLGAALSYNIQDTSNRTGIVALFLYLFAVAYSPGLGPIPFTLASESFPLSHREAGTAWPISINLFFAGLLSMLYPAIRDDENGLGDGGSLGLFAGLNVLAFILVFFLVEETKSRSLEDLDLVFAVSKRRFMSFQVQEYLPWFVCRYILNRDEPPPELYHDYIWGPWKREAGLVTDVAVAAIDPLARSWV
ncbi:sugar transporter [Emericellopsis atlantica]|uniref:Sugar transporter n=1 Tax=Emericellopsis atlantica TaxID=2614577 RepID=A0A9P7ZF33_9HYPO|nr:sugar transporter [Emericellopsis atlantica]KAG9250536.1 sugar transporter [Emericellopsis atlantica]